MTGSVSITMLPARDGDCLFVESQGFRLLIDGGRSQTGKVELPAFLAALPVRPGKPTVDLMVLTHVDADHVAGLLTLLAIPDAATFGEVWFNGLDHHKKAAGLFVPPRVPAGTVGTGVPSGTLNVSQAVDFHRLVEAHGLVWNARMGGEAVMIDGGSSLPRINLTDGLVLILLGPPRQKLANFYPDWQTAVKGLEKKPTLAARPRTVPTVANVRQLAIQQDIADQTKPNGASISFILEAGSKRVLFAADAHPEDILSGLLQYTDADRVFFDAIKVSHHGSAKNNTSALINKLQSPHWLISTDGSRHKHPDAEAVARIVLTPGAGKMLSFNYRSEMSKSWDAKDLKDTFSYGTRYGNGKMPLTVTV